MAIRLETSKRNGIENYQDSELSVIKFNWLKQLGKSHSRARPRTDPSSAYNCHGLTFASRRTSLEKSSGIQLILKDDDYNEITDMKDILPGDIVIYYSTKGDPNHSGMVVESGGQLIVPLICSKWANAGEFVHGLRDCPQMYGPITRFFRCKR